MVDQAVFLQPGSPSRSEFDEAIASRAGRFLGPHGNDRLTVFAQQTGAPTMTGEIDVTELLGRTDRQRPRVRANDEPCGKIVLQVQVSPAMTNLAKEDVEPASGHRVVAGRARAVGKCLCDICQGFQEGRSSPIVVGWVDVELELLEHFE